MRRRLYFLLPDVDCARRTADDLLLARIEHRHMHFLARRGTPLGELHEASILQKTDAVHGAELGLAVGAIAGLIVGIYMYLTPPEGGHVMVGVIAIGALVGALFGIWAASLVALSVPNSRLKRFAPYIEGGKVLLIVDVPLSRVDDVQSLVRGRHPEAADHGVEPTVPAFP
jgi:hypothetical protein